MYSDSAGSNLSAYEVRAYEEFPLLMPRWGYVASAFVLFLIGFFGFFLNLLVILLMFKDRQLWTPLNIILFNLVCSDFSVSLLGNPFTLTSALFHRWMFGERMCVLYGFFMALLGITSITTLTVLSFERYMMVSRPFSSRHLTRRSACFTIILIWSYSLALTLPPLFGWGKYVSEAANISCSVNWQEQTTNALTYILFLFAMGQVVPCAVIGFSYYNILRTMKKNSQRMGRTKRAETKVAVMIFIMILAFMVAWTPYSITALLEQFGEHGVVSPGVGVIPALIAKSSICYNPLIYVGMNTQYRSSIKRMLGIHSKDTTGNEERACDQTVVSDSGGRFKFNVISVKKDPTTTSQNQRKQAPNTTFQYQRKQDPNTTCRNQSEKDQTTTSQNQSKKDQTTTSQNQRTQDPDKQVAISEGAVKKRSYVVYSVVDDQTSTTDSTETNRLHRKTTCVMAPLNISKKENANSSKAVYKNTGFESIADEGHNESARKEPRRNSLHEKLDLEETEKLKTPLKISSSLEIARVMLAPPLRKKSITVVIDKNLNISNSMRNKLFERSNGSSENFKTLLFPSNQTDHEENTL